MSEFTVPDELADVDEKVLTDFVRDHPLSKNWQREIKEQEQRLKLAEGKVSTFEAEQKLTLKAKDFEAAGLKPSWAKFYPDDAPREPEALKTWATENDFAVAPAQEPAPVEPKATVTPTVTGTPPGPQKMSREDFDQLMRSDPARALSMKPEEIAWRHQ